MHHESESTARSTAAPPGEDGAEREDSDLSTPSALFAACRRRVDGFIVAQTEILFSRADEDLFTAAREAESDEVQRECFDAMQELARLKPAIGKGFRANVAASLDALWAAEVPSEPEELAATAELAHLTLVDTQAIEDEVEVVKIASKASAGLRAVEGPLEHRLSCLLPAPLAPGKNPLSAKNVCMAFYEAIQNLGAERTSRRELYRALEATVIEALGGLHQELNEMMVAQGIAPTIPRARPRPVGARGGPVPAPAGTPEPVPAPDYGSGQVLPSAEPAAFGVGAPAAMNPSGVDGGYEAGGAEFAIPFHTAFASIQHLMGLERSLSVAGAPPPTAPASGSEPSVTDSRVAIDAALARIQASGEAESWGEKGPYAFGMRVRTALAREGVVLEDPAVTDALDVISTLLDNILADPLVHPASKARIRRVGVPLSRAALTDGTFFASDAHPARQTINRLGRLSPAGDGAEGEQGHSTTDVDGVLDRLLASRGADRATFGQAAGELDALLARQNRRFEKKVATLVENLDRQESIVEQRGAGRRQGEAQLSTAEAAHEDWQRALECVSHLEPGAVLILGATSATPRPATVVWRSRASGQLVVADGRGERAGSYGRRELAMALLRDSVRVDEAARMPIVDRAMCGVLQGLHGKLEHKANRDPLTGLANRKRFGIELAGAMRAPLEPGRAHHVCALGLAGLPALTDRFGERAADTLVIRYAQVLERQFGESALAAHLGEGQFMVLLESAAPGEVKQLMERHQRSIKSSKCAYRGEAITLAAAVGVVPVAPGSVDADAAMDAAEDALEEARADSPMGLYVKAAEGAQPGATPEGGLPDVSELIAAGRLTLRCQRVVPVEADNELKPYYEVLLGVRNEEGRVGPPGELILAAERSGKIAELDRWVVAEALRWMSANDDKLTTLKGVAINLSGATLSDPALVDFVADELKAAGVPPERIMFEVTESAAIDRLSVARAFIESFQSLGCRFALDDFGAGHASFSYLKLLPVDTVKIDGLFVREIASNPADEAMVRSINEVAKLLGKQTVAEFVEDETALQRLRDLGVDYAQGFGIERPILLDELLRRSEPERTETAATG